MPHRTDRQTSLSSTVVATPDQVHCALEGEAVILHLPSGTYYGLNPIGARIWSLLQDPITVAGLRDTLQAEYDVDRERLERDLLDLVNELHSRELIEVRHPTPA